VSRRKANERGRGDHAEVTGATDPTDRALLATLALFLDHVERLLNT